MRRKSDYGWLRDYERRKEEVAGGREPSQGWISDKYDLQSMDKNEIIPELFFRDGVTPLTLGDAANALKKSWTAYYIAKRKGEPRGDICYRIVNLQEKLGIEQSDFAELSEEEEDYN